MLTGGDPDFGIVIRPGLLTLVVYLTGELWQTIGFLAIVAIVFMVTTIRDEVRDASSRELGAPPTSVRVCTSTRRESRALCARSSGRDLQ